MIVKNSTAKYEVIRKATVMFPLIFGTALKIIRTGEVTLQFYKVSEFVNDFTNVNVFFSGDFYRMIFFFLYGTSLQFLLWSVLLPFQYLNNFHFNKLFKYIFSMFALGFYNF